MSNIFKLATIRIVTKDFMSSKAFVERLFEMSPIEDQELFASYMLEGIIIDLVQEDDFNLSSSGGAIPYWEVSGLDDVLAKAQQLGAEIYRGPLLVEETLQKIVQIKSSCGLILGFEQRIQ
ncbi:MAG: putative enzyme related to lactoylglutathione lyase [Bacteriovoracaceae bacterium]|jgi:predicted enzyme related to lactoylglutathione lyase